FFLDTDILPKMVGWRLAFAVGMVLAVFVFVVRKNVPESPRWLFIHGRNDEAERIVGDIEDGVEAETSQTLPPADKTITVRQRTTISFAEIAKVAFQKYPKRAVLCLVLFVGQAFLYNGVTFNLGTIFNGFYGIAEATVPIFIILWSLSNFLGPVVLGRFFDTIGRKPMISFSYLGSAAVAVVLAVVFRADVGGEWLFLVILVVCFFLASSGASAAYLTVSEIFPMETRALAIAFFYAIGTAAGGIAGPLLFGRMIESENRSLVALAFLIGAGVMALGGVAELLFGVKAERADLEDIAKPLTAEDAEEQAPEVEGSAVGGEPEGTSARGRTPRTGSRLRPGPGSAGVDAPWPAVSSRGVPPDVSAKDDQGMKDDDRARDRQVSMPPGRRCPHAMAHRRSRPRKSRASSTTSATCSRSAMSNSTGPSARVAGARDGTDRRCARRSAKDTSGGIAEGGWKPPTTEGPRRRGGPPRPLRREAPSDQAQREEGVQCLRRLEPGSRRSRSRRDLGRPPRRRRNGSTTSGWSSSAPSRSGPRRCTRGRRSAGTVTSTSARRLSSSGSWQLWRTETICSPTTASTGMR